MFSVGASIGLVGGAALIDAVDGKYTDAFFILGPIATIAGFSFLVTMAHPSLPNWKICKQCKKHSDEEAVKESTDEKQKTRVLIREFFTKLAHIDWVGTLLVTAGAILFLVGINQVVLYCIDFCNKCKKAESWGWTSAKTLCLVIIGIILLIGWVVFDAWIKRPLVPMRIMLNRNLFFHTLVAFLTGFVMFSYFQTLPYVLTSPLLNFGYSIILRNDLP